MTLVGRKSLGRERGTQAVRGGGRDVLSTLPHELLDHIFARVRFASHKRGIGAISKRLLPYTRSTRFHTLHVNSYASLKHLCQVLHEDERLGIYVARLFIRLGDDEWIRDDEGSPDLEVGVSHEDLFHLFSTLTSLKVLSLESAAGITLALSDWLAHSYQPSSRSRSIRSIGALQIKGRGCALSPEVVVMTSYFHNLSAITLVDDSYHASVDLNPFLLAAPPGVESLSISLSGSNRDEEGPFPIDATLSRFTQLQSLNIDHPSTGPALYDILREIPVCYLTFGPRSRPNGPQLLTLLQGNNRSETLRALDLSNVTGLIGDRIIDHPAAHEPLYSYEPQHEGWTFPVWTEEFTEDNAMEIEEVARAAEVSLDGTVLNAFEALEQYWRQVTELQRLRVE